MYGIWFVPQERVGQRSAGTNDGRAADEGWFGWPGHYTDDQLGVVRAGLACCSGYGADAVLSRGRVGREIDATASTGRVPEYTAIFLVNNPVAIDGSGGSAQLCAENSGVVLTFFHRTLNVKWREDMYRNGILAATAEVAIVVLHRKPVRSTGIRLDRKSVV